jgi:Synapsin, ATP binding domain/Synapsin, N-terminal domain
MKGLFGGKSDSKKPSQSQSHVASMPTTSDSVINLLVISQGHHDTNWIELFNTRNATLADGRHIIVEQTGWEHIFPAVYTHTHTQSRTNLNCEIIAHIQPSRKPLPGTNQHKPRTFKPDFLLIRNEVRALTAAHDHRNVLFAFMYGGLGRDRSVNSLQSVYSFLEKPIVHGELLRINARLGQEAFPLIEQNFFAGHREMMYGLEFPAVVKLGHAHAGYGKMRCRTHHDMDDIRSMVAMTSHYCSVEPFKTGAYDLRIQKIGKHIRAFKRTTVSGNWKTNTGSSQLETVQVTEQYRMWAEEASKMFGGLDICTVDALHTTDDSKDGGKEYILEVNPSSSGFAPDFETEDNQHVIDLVLEKMNAVFCPVDESVVQNDVQNADENADSASADDE